MLALSDLTVVEPTKSSSKNVVEPTKTSSKNLVYTNGNWVPPSLPPTMLVVVEVPPASDAQEL